MADDSGQDKTEDPTEKRLADAKKKGQIPRSRELNTFVMLMTGTILLILIGPSIGNGLVDLIRQQFQLNRDVFYDPASIGIYFEKAMYTGILLITPLALVLSVVALLTPIAMGGWNFTMNAMSPKLSKMNPLSGLKRMVGTQGLIELIKAIIKIALVFTVAGNLFNFYLDQFMGLSALPIEDAIYKMVDIIGFALLMLCSTLLLVVAIDVPYQLWNNKRQLKMSKQEIKDESKDQEGSPEIKSRIRRKQMELAQQRMMDQVPSADVVVTNPSHFAVALKYDMLGSGAPTLVAKGADLIAAQIRIRASSVDVPLVAAPPLARALYYSTEIGEEIPQGLFLAVAQILAYVFQLKTATENGWEKPMMPNDLQVPDSYRQV
jgi:flagellar biosynthetic protein FlhB